MEKNVERTQMFTYLNQKIKSTTDPYYKAAFMRQLGYLKYLEALRTGEDEVGFVVDQYLQEYTNFVTQNSLSSVNNYTSEVTRLLKSRQTPVDPSKWNPILENFDDLISLSDTPSCKGEYLNCKHAETAEFINFSNNKFWDCTVTDIEKSLNGENSWTAQNPLKRSFSEQHKMVESNILKIDRSCQTDSTPVLNQNPPSTSSIKNPHQQLTNFSHNPTIVKNSPRQQFKPEEPSHSGFRTAKEELIVRNLKTHGNNPSSHQNLASAYGTSNKSLGGKWSVRSKFIPPVKAVVDEVQQRMFGSSEKQEEPVDERLKNIDPKMVELISNEIMHKVNHVDWNDIAGLDYAKSTIQEAVVWPLLRPDIFTGIRRPPRGILLFGPPGTGKTLIGKCIASQSKSTFFSISASALTSKWVGEGEKMVRALFAVAAIHQPAVIFIDEIDSLLSQRSNDEHESSRRIKTEFLVQLDGAATSQEERLLIVGATNRPQELDEAARRRLVTRLYIPLPELEARKQILQNLLKTVNNSLTEDQFHKISQLAEGYSGADMECLCREASMEPIRCIPSLQIPYFSENEVRPINIDDFHVALTRVKASVSQDDIQQYITWNKIFGSGNNR